MATVIAISAVIIIGIVVARYFLNRRLTEEGKIVERKGAFWEDEHLFSTTASYEAVREAIDGTSFNDCKAEAYSDYNGQKCVLFKSSDAWNAEVVYCGEQDGKNQFIFHFLIWKHEGIYTMNIILTTVEKLFFSLDPATTVQTRRMQVKTQTTFF